MIKQLFNSGKRFLLWLLLPITSLFMVSCSSDKDEQEPTPGNGSLQMKIKTNSPQMPCELLVTSQEGSEVNTQFTSLWKSNFTIDVWAKQSGKLVYLGEQDFIVESSDKKSGTVEFDATGKLDASKPYEVYGLGCSWKRDGEDLYYRTNLHRGGSFGIYFKVAGRQNYTETNDIIAGTSEILFIINKSGSPIKFRHKGFDAEKKWYYTHAEVSIESGKMVNTEQKDEAVSDVVDIAAFTGKNAYRIYSYYVPNGNKIQDAQLIAEIDGKEVRSENRISSDITLQTNHVYGIFAIWDGEKLTLGDDGTGNGIIELPADANVSYDELSVICDGQIIDVSEEGYFETDASSVIAFNGSNIVFFSYTCEDEKHVLDALETAISLLLPSIPLAISDFDDTQLWIMKKMIGHLDETKTLADAINQSVKSKGFLDIDEISVQYSAAISELKRRFGLDDIYENISNSASINKVIRKEMGVPSYPYFKNTFSKESYADGFTVTMTSSSLEEKDGKKFWKCKFDLLNADRFCYTTFTKGYKGNNGLFGRLDDSFTDTFRNLIKPMNLSAFMDFGTLSDLATNPKDFLTTLSEPDFDRVINQFWEPMKNLGHLIIGEPTETVTYDKIHVKDIELSFYTSNEHLLIAGPGNDDNLVLFNIVRIGFQPVLKMIMGEVKKTEGYKNSDLWDKIFVEFVKWMSEADLAFRAKLISTFTDSSLSWGERLEIFVDVFERFDQFFQKEGLNLVSEAVFKKYMSSVYKGYNDPQIKAIFTTYKAILTAGDILQLILDIGYNGVAFELVQGIDQNDGDLEDIPGSDL